MARARKNPAPAAASGAPPPSALASFARRHGWWLMPVLTAALFGIPHLPHPFWHDEIYTELFFAHDPVRALTDYHVPNNHILFSLLWWLFRKAVDEPAYWRLLPFGFFLAGAAFMALAGARWVRDRRGGWWAGMVFAVAHPVISFAVELRGYSPSLTFLALALYALAGWRDADPGRWRWPLLYAAAAFLAVGTVPVNMAAFAPLAVWMGWSRRKEPDFPGRWGRAAWCAATPLSGLAFLIPVRHQLAESVKAGSAMTKWSFALHYPYAAALDFVWLPVAAWLAWRWWVAPAIAPSADAARVKASSVFGPGTEGRDSVAFTAISILTPMACCLALPRTPNDYTLVATMPAICLGFAWMTWVALTGGGVRDAGGEAASCAPKAKASERGRRRGIEAWCAVGALMVGVAAFREWSKVDWAKTALPSEWIMDASGENAAGYNLENQRYQNNMAPIEVTESLMDYLEKEGVDDPLILVEGGDILPAAMYWRWLAMDRFPKSLALLVPDDVGLFTREGAQRLWRTHSRRFFILSRKAIPSGDLLYWLTPEDRGHVTAINHNWEYVLMEWKPGTRPDKNQHGIASDPMRP